MNTKVAKKNNKGFTLIELIVVIAIIAVLAAILAPQYLRYVEKSRVSADESTCKEFVNAVNTSLAEEVVYNKVADATGAVTATWPIDGGKPTATVTELQNELQKTIDTMPAVKSKKYRTKDACVATITIDPDTQTYSVKDSWGVIS